jgi:hypothetical protein
METYGGSGCVDPRFLDLGISLRWVVSFTSQPLYLDKEALVPIGQEAGWTPELVWTTWRKVLTLPWLELRPLDCPARSQSLYRLSYRGSTFSTIRCSKHVMLWVFQKIVYGFLSSSDDYKLCSMFLLLLLYFSQVPIFCSSVWPQTASLYIQPSVIEKLSIKAKLPSLLVYKSYRYVTGKPGLSKN